MFILRGRHLSAEEKLMTRTRLRCSPAILYLALLQGSPTIFAQESVDTRPSGISISEFAPTPRARLNRTEISKAKFPVVDVHTHFFHRTRHDLQQLRGLVELMDRQNIAICVSLDGTLGRQLEQHIEFLWTEYLDRFVIFANFDWKGSAQESDYPNWDCNQPGFVRRVCQELQQAKTLGVSGLKVFKTLGLQVRNADGSLTEVDDPRFDPIWETCGQLGLPVLIHTADPSAFFQPLTRDNERYEELIRHPEWHFTPDKFPTREHLLAARQRVFSRHPKTNFIAAHFGNDAEDLTESATLLESCPNVVLDIASRISELGRQPYSSRDFIIRYQDRILFGTDGPWPEQRYNCYWRFLQTRDEYFPYSEKAVPPQGIWHIYGIELPDSVLRKIYSGNTVRLIPGIRERLQRLSETEVDNGEK